MIRRLDDSHSFGRRLDGELPSVEAEAHGSICNDRAIASERVFPPSLSEQTASATDRHDFGRGPGERW